MTRDEFQNIYFDWITQLVGERDGYRKLLAHLHGIDFEYSMEMDGNRFADGTDLRYRFGYECGYDDILIAEYLDNRPCSVLELMAALALKCEEHIMDDPEVGPRLDIWFWSMIDSLGLSGMTDEQFDIRTVDRVIRRFMDRKYQPNGSGGLFTVKGKGDLRRAEIWYQMCWYLDSLE